MKIAVIGGGAAGLISAISAARSGANVTILERTDRIGKKILATGNGRCNMTNIFADVNNYHGQNSKFATGALKRFTVQDTIDFFAELGVLTKVEDKGKTYPYSNQASAVLDVLRMEIERLGIQVICDFEANDIKCQKSKFKIMSYKQDTFIADKVIVATGGKASPNLGSNGSGYPLLKKMGHSITELFPALVQVKTDTEFVRGLQGVKQDCIVSVMVGEKVLIKEDGEVLFTEYGLSGPPIFALSRIIASEIIKNKKVIISLDLMPEYSKKDITVILKNRIMADGNKRLENFFIGMLNKKIGQVLLKASGVMPLSKTASSLSDKEISNIVDNLKGWGFHAVGTMSWNNAQVTAGGVSTNEVSPNTFESKIVKGLYIVGEVLDIDGDCGGYNLQWAWSSGYIAGKFAAEK